MVPCVWMSGTLAGQQRASVLRETLGAKAAEPRPEGHGMWIASGNDFQNADRNIRAEWLRWAEVPGRVFLLVPPLSVGECEEPFKWRVYRQPQIASGGTRGLAKLLAGEVKHEVAGAFQVPEELSGSWENGGINTALFRKHPHSGLFAITCLPIWSLTVLDQRDELLAWVESLYGLSGQPVAAQKQPEAPVEFRPNADHYAIMLHLCEGTYRGREEALATLAVSPVLAVPGGQADTRFQELEDAGLVAGGQLTDQGRSALFASPYACYAEQMEIERR